MPTSPRRTRLAFGVALVAGVLAIAAGCGGTTTAGDDEAPPDEAALVAAVGDRLALAVDVAETKWNTGAAIEDLAREAEAIAAVEGAAVAAGVDPEVASDTLRAQIEASKAVQRSLHARWEAEDHGPFDGARDLAGEIRPDLDVATAAMLEALATVALPLPADRLDQHAAALRERLADVPDPGPAVQEALSPFG
jgi:chorismate mutase